ncbi:hypothetical protein LJC56_09410 [Christensenellaceae bacterium OttesenSCG-928-K19]|nr:hypothetical protein [Christensenellaceae bacterium OttesenSCG-928-K19]
MKKICAMLILCVMLITGCSGEEEMSTSALYITAAEKSKALDAEYPTISETDTIPMRSSEGATDAESVETHSPSPRATGKPASTITPNVAPDESSSSNASIGQHMDSSNPNKTPVSETTTPATSTPSEPTSVSADSDLTPIPAPTPEPTQAPTPATTPPQAIESPKQGGYAYCSCCAALMEDEYVTHMKQHALNDEDHHYDTY